MNKKENRDAYFLLPFSPCQAVRGFLAFLGLLPVFAGLVFIASLLPEESLQKLLPGFRWHYSNYRLILPVFILCLVSAYREELYFRSYLLKELGDLGAGLGPSVIISLLLFASGHLYQGIAGFTVALILGGYLSFAFRLAKSVHVPALAHGLYNFCILLLSGLV